MSNVPYRARVGMILSEGLFGFYHFITVIIAVLASLVAMSAIPIFIYAVALLALLKIATTKWWKGEATLRVNQRRLYSLNRLGSIDAYSHTYNSTSAVYVHAHNPIAMTGDNFERLYQMIKAIHRYETIAATAKNFSSQDLLKARTFLDRNQESLRKAKENFDRMWSSILVQINGVHELGEFIEPAQDHVDLEDDDMLAREIDELGNIDKQLHRLTVEAMAEKVVAEQNSPYYYNHEPYTVESKRTR